MDTMAITDLLLGVAGVCLGQHPQVQGALPESQVHHLLLRPGHHLLLHGGNGRQDAGPRDTQGRWTVEGRLVVKVVLAVG